MLLIDSSAIVKYFSKEPGWESVEQYLEEATTIPLALAELGNALLRKSVKGEIGPQLAKVLLESYSKSAVLVEQNRYVVPAFRIAVVNKLSIYDSLFIVAALDKGYDLVSADERQIKIARNLGINTFKC